MGDFTVDDLLFDHPKALAAGEDATNLYVRGLAWASRHNTGLIPKPAVRTLTAKSNHAALAARLTHIAPGCTEPLWHDRGDHFEINDWATRNALRASRREAGKRGAKARWQTPPFANGKSGDVPYAKTPVLPDGRIEVGQCQDKEEDKDVVSSSSKLTVVPKPPADDENGPNRTVEAAFRLLAERNLEARQTEKGQVANREAWLAEAVRRLREAHPDPQPAGLTAAQLADLIQPPPARDPNTPTTRPDGSTFLPGTGWIPAPVPDCPRPPGCDNTGRIVAFDGSDQPCPLCKRSA